MDGGWQEYRGYRGYLHPWNARMPVELWYKVAGNQRVWDRLGAGAHGVDQPTVHFFT